MAFETEYISRPKLGTSADVPDVPSHTSMVTYRVVCMPLIRIHTKTHFAGFSLPNLKSNKLRYAMTFDSIRAETFSTLVMI